MGVFAGNYAVHIDVNDATLTYNRNDINRQRVNVIENLDVECRDKHFEILHEVHISISKDRLWLIP